MKYFNSEIIIASLVVISAALLWNPYWMPMGGILVAVIAFVIFVGGFTVFVWKEQGGDERDALIRHVASRSAYLATAAVLAVGIVYQTLALRSADNWLIAAFMVLIIFKIVGYVSGRRRY